jgi:hypothetical protein
MLYLRRDCNSVSISYNFKTIFKGQAKLILTNTSNTAYTKVNKMCRVVQAKLFEKETVLKMVYIGILLTA